MHPENVLLDEEGHILLTYFGSWEDTDHIPDETAMNHFYCAPGNDLLVNIMMLTLNLDVILIYEWCFTKSLLIDSIIMLNYIFQHD